MIPSIAVEVNLIQPLVPERKAACGPFNARDGFLLFLLPRRCGFVCSGLEPMDISKIDKIELV
jgi:hypothetical protein